MQAARGGIVGRERELGAVEAFLAGRPSGASALLLAGEAGIGKTTIWEESVRLAREQGLRVLATRLAESEQELPYAGLADLLDTVGDDELAPLPEPQRIAVDAARARASAGGPVDQHPLSRGVLELLRAAAGDGRLLLAVDDVQWLDRPTVATLGFALRRIGDVPLRVFVAARTTAGSPSDPPLGLGDWDAALRRVDVGPLQATELGAVLSTLGGTSLPRPQLEKLAHASRGNPMFALELARAGFLTRGSVKLPSTLSLALADRIDALEPDARAAVVLASASLQPAVELLLRAGADEDGVRSALRSGILEVDGSRVSFAHPLLSTAAYERLLPEERRDVHARLARASEGPIERGHHISRSAAGPSDSAALALDRAATETEALGDHAGAAAFLLRAAELSSDPDGEGANERRARAAAALETAGDLDTAGTLARSLVDRLPPGPLRARARQTAASCGVGSSLPLDSYIAELELALADAGGDDELSASLHLAIANALSIMFRLTESQEHVLAARELAERAGSPAIVLASLAEAGFLDSMLGHGVSENALRAFERWDGTPLAPETDTPRMVLACARLHAAEFSEAARLFAEEIEMAERGGLEAIEVGARMHLAEAQLRSGDCASALLNARVGVEHARQAASAQEIAGSSFGLASVEALIGNHDSARALSTAALEDAESAADTWYTVSHRSVLGFVALADDDLEEAVAVLEPAWTLIVQHGLGDLSIFPVANVIGEAYVGMGRSDDARAVVAALRASPAGVRPWSAAMAARCEALIASNDGDHASARDAIEQALAEHAGLPEPFELARTLLIAGQIERRAKRRAEARQALTSALDIFDTLGAPRWAEKAAAELARIPGRAPASGDLSETERRVAELVASGLSNKQVAARLFVTIRTVEGNLTRIYAKLGVRSRTELAARLGGETSVPRE